MFTSIKSKEELIKELTKRIGVDIVIHYNCEECDDEQVTYDDEVTEEMIEELENRGYLMVNYECTNCDNITKFLEVDYIQGIEENF